MTLRPALRHTLAALAVLAGAALAHAPAAAQDTIPRPRPLPADTIPRVGPDSVQVPIPPEAVRGDTLPDRGGTPAARDTAQQDTTVPAPLFPAHPRPPAFGFADGAWVLDREALRYFQGQSLAELLDRIPGLVITRTGSFGRPMGVSPFGAGGGRFRIFVDGWELRRLNGSVPDLQQVPLVNLESVRIQRTLQEVRIDLTSFRLSDARPYAQIEGADGDYDSRILRGFFTRPVGRFLPEIGLDLVETDGYRRREPFGASHRVARISYLFAPDVGVQLEYRGAAIDSEDRGLDQGDPQLLESFDRSELVLRARARLLGGLWLDGQVGRARQEPVGDDETTPEAESVQALLRATFQARFGTLGGGVRLYRSDDETWGPDGTEVFARADLTPSPIVSAWAEARSIAVDGASGVETEGGARVGPFGGFSLFGSIAAGGRGIRFAQDTALEVPTAGGVIGFPGQEVDTLFVADYRTLESSLNGLRAGAELARGNWVVGAAYVVQDVDRLAPYGLFFDRGLAPVDGDAASAVEAYVSAPVIWPSLRLDGWYLRFLGDAGRPYQPTQLGRAALQFNRVYFGGNFEPTVRLEAVARDEALAREAVTGGVTVPTQAYALFNLSVQLRILDIRVFWRFENLANRRSAFDVPGFQLPGGRALFGLRWFFRN